MYAFFNSEKHNEKEISQRSHTNMQLINKGNFIKSNI